MSITIKLKRGSESSILAATLEVGELAFSTDMCSIWSYNGVSKCIVGRAVVDTYSNIATYSGAIGRFFYASDTEQLYIHTGVEWVSGGVSRGQLTTVSGDIVTQIPSLSGYATQTWVGDQNYATISKLTTASDDIVSWVTNQSYITSSKLTTTSGDIVSQIPNLSSYVPTTRTVNGKALSGNITLTLASVDFANQGTTSGVLHGNAAGNPAFSQIIEADLNLTDLTMWDATINRHGFVPKLPNDDTVFYDGKGNFSTPAGGPSGASTAKANIFLLMGA